MISYALNALKLHNFLSVTFGAEVAGRPVRDRQHSNDRRAILLALNAQDDHARAIFKPFVLAGLVLSAPKVGIGND